MITLCNDLEKSIHIIKKVYPNGILYPKWKKHPYAII